MSDYKRFLSYIYWYENENKMANLGFAKVEVRGNGKRVDVTLKKNNKHQENTWSIYGLMRKESNCIMVCLGTMDFVGENGKFSWSTIKPYIKDENESVRFEDFIGLAILARENDKKGYVTLWDDEEFSFSNLDTYERYIQNKKTNITSTTPLQTVKEQEGNREKQVEKTMESTKNIDHERENNYEKDMEYAKDSKDESMIESNKDRKLIENSNNNMLMENRKDTECIENMKSNEWIDNPREIENVQTVPMLENGEASLHMTQANMTKEDMEYFVEGYNVEESQQNNEEYNVYLENRKKQNALEEMEEEQCMEQPFFKDMEHHFPKENVCGYDPTVKCFRIHPADLGILPKENWYLGNNSFLLHGYFNHRYLVVLRRKEDGEYQYYIGVPGTNLEREQTMATMFGFTTFIRDRENNDQSANGFWCIKVLGLA